jgi:hypothetical protein
MFPVAEAAEKQVILDRLDPLPGNGVRGTVRFGAAEVGAEI